MANFMNLLNIRRKRERAGDTTEIGPVRQVPTEVNRMASVDANVMAEDMLLSAQIRREALGAVKRRGVKNF